MTANEMLYALFINVACFAGFFVAVFFVLGVMIRAGQFTRYEYNTIHVEPRDKPRVVRAYERDGWRVLAIYQDSERGGKLAIELKKKYSTLPWAKGNARDTDE